MGSSGGGGQEVYPAQAGSLRSYQRKLFRGNFPSLFSSTPSSVAGRKALTEWV